MFIKRNVLLFIIKINLVFGSSLLLCNENETCIERNNCTTSLYVEELSPCNSATNLNTICCPRKFDFFINNNNNKCGAMKAKKFTFDRVALVETFPWSALLGYDVPNNRREFLCGGTLITKNFVLSAANCLDPQPAKKLTFVRLGEMHLNTIEDCDFTKCSQTYLDVDVGMVFFPPQYNAGTLRADIGLVQLKQNIKFTDHIRPICLPFQYHDLNIHKEIFTINGWNLLGTNKLEKMHFANVKEIRHKKCKQMTKRKLDKTQMCVRHVHQNLEEEEDVNNLCVGDNGGGLIYEDAHTNKAYLIGVASQQPPPHHPSSIVYTLVQPYMKDFIYQFINHF